MGLYLYGHALKEMLRARRLVPWLLVSALIALMGKVWPQMVPGETPVQQYADVASMLVFRVIAIASAIYTTAIVSQEVEGRTIVYILTRPVARWKLLCARYLAAVTVVSFVGFIAALFLTAVVFNGAIGSNELLLGDLKAIVVGALAYNAVFLFVSLVTQRAMIVCILFVFWELSVTNLPGDLAYLTILSYVQAIAQHPATIGGPKAGMLTGQLGTTAITSSVAYQVMILTAVALLGVCLWWFTHFEYVPREDVE